MKKQKPSPMSQDEALTIAECVIDTLLRDSLKRNFTESEEAGLAVAIYRWAKRNGIPTED